MINQALSKMHEKRKLNRFDLKVPAKVEVMTSDQEKEIFNLLTSDICSGGAFFHTPQPLPEGTPVRIDLILSLDKLKDLKDNFKHAYIKVAGTVLRSESAGMAICFNEDYQIRPYRAKAVAKLRCSAQKARNHRGPK